MRNFLTKTAIVFLFISCGGRQVPQVIHQEDKEIAEEIQQIFFDSKDEETQADTAEDRDVFTEDFYAEEEFSVSESWTENSEAEEDFYKADEDSEGASDAAGEDLAEEDSASEDLVADSISKDAAEKDFAVSETQDAESETFDIAYEDYYQYDSAEENAEFFANDISQNDIGFFDAVDETFDVAEEEVGVKQDIAVAQETSDSQENAEEQDVSAEVIADAAEDLATNETQDAKETENAEDAIDEDSTTVNNSYAVYKNEIFGFQFEYPVEWVVVVDYASEVALDSKPYASLDEPDRIYIEIKILQNETGGPDNEWLEELQKTLLDSAETDGKKVSLDIIGTGEHLGFYSVVSLQNLTAAVNLRYISPADGKIQNAAQNFAHILITFKSL